MEALGTAPATVYQWQAIVIHGVEVQFGLAVCVLEVNEICDWQKHYKEYKSSFHSTNTYHHHRHPLPSRYVTNA